MVVADAGMAVEADVYQPVVAAPAIGINHRHNVDFIPKCVMKGLFGAAWDDFRVHLVAAFEQTKYDGFTAGATALFAAHPPLR